MNNNKHEPQKSLQLSERRRAGEEIEEEKMKEEEKGMGEGGNKVGG